MTELTFHTVDVFTDRVFGGNPLGIFPDAGELPDALMQSVAREMNLSETVFLARPPTPGGPWPVRIFTPAVEVPFAGHPTIGTALFLAQTGRVDLPEGGGTIVLREKVGPVPVDVEVEGNRPARARLSAAVPPEHRECPWSAEELGTMLSLPPDAIGCPAGTVEGVEPLEPELVSAGLPFVVVPVRDLDAARRARLDTGSWERRTTGAWSRMMYVVSPEAEGPGVDLHVRMFAPAAGVPEDPATGSAGVALAAFLGRRCPPATGVRTFRWTVEQGLEMGRPSRLEIEADVTDGSVEAVRVGGRSVPVSSGTMTVPGGNTP
ncbi:MAG: PhzF family phenazine biosynthesis protein [Gemmatimonadota bacterium]|jgi:trans-2,3-dihydro-3-hydroxyanthranilate isomerase